MQTPNSGQESSQPAPDAPLATRGQRLAAAIVDLGLMSLGVVVFLVAAKVTRFRPVDDDPSTGLAGLALVAWWVLVGLVDLVMLARWGQTPGKRLMRLRIVRLDGAPAPFESVVVLRTLLTLIFDLVPGFALIDALFIFRDDRRCLHDLIAGTKVVALGPPRTAPI